MMYAKQVYEAQRAQAWTRVDMLIALYDSGITSLTGALEAMKNQQTVQADSHRYKALRVIHGLVAGLDLNQGEIPKQIVRLCEYMQHALSQPNTDNIASCLHIMTTLRESFHAIRDEAAGLENSGQIPPLSLNNTVQVTV